MNKKAKEKKGRREILEVFDLYFEYLMFANSETRIHLTYLQVTEDTKRKTIISHTISVRALARKPGLTDWRTGGRQPFIHLLYSKLYSF